MALKNKLPNVIILTIFLAHCSTEEELRVSNRSTPQPTCTSTKLDHFELAGEVVYKGRIEGILQTKCVGCHSPVGRQQPYFNNYASAKEQADYIIAAIERQSMPPRNSSPLAAGDLTALQQWRKDGLLLEAPMIPKPNDPTNPTPKPSPTPGDSGDAVRPDYGESVGNNSADGSKASSSSDCRS